MLSKQLNKNHYGRVCQSRLIPGEGPRYLTHNIYVLDLKGNIIAQPKQSNKIISIERWTYPFHIYFSTYVAVHLVRTQQLIKYIHDIHLDAQFNSWRTTSVVMAHNPSRHQSQYVYAHQCLKYNGSHPYLLCVNTNTHWANQTTHMEHPPQSTSQVADTRQSCQHKASTYIRQQDIWDVLTLPKLWISTRDTHYKIHRSLAPFRFQILNSSVIFCTYQFFTIFILQFILS